MLLRADGSVFLLEPLVLQRQLSHDNLAFHAWFREVVTTRTTVVSDLHISPATQRPTVVIATPVFLPDGRLAGVWAGALQLDELVQRGSLEFTDPISGVASAVARVVLKRDAGVAPLLAAIDAVMQPA
jgi:hypothetical protein